MKILIINLLIILKLNFNLKNQFKNKKFFKIVKNKAKYRVKISIGDKENIIKRK